MNKRNLSRLKKATTTTRGTPRQRAPKGLAQSLRYQVLAELPDEDLEAALGVKLARMPSPQRHQLSSELHALSGQPRRELILKVLSE